MTQQLLDGPDVVAVFEQMGGVMSQRVATGWLRDSSFQHRRANGLLQHGFLQMVPSVSTRHRIQVEAGSRKNPLPAPLPGGARILALDGLRELDAASTPAQVLQMLAPNPIEMGRQRCPNLHTPSRSSGCNGELEPQLALGQEGEAYPSVMVAQGSAGTRPPTRQSLPSAPRHISASQLRPSRPLPLTSLGAIRGAPNSAVSNGVANDILLGSGSQVRLTASGHGLAGRERSPAPLPLQPSPHHRVRPRASQVAAGPMPTRQRRRALHRR